MQVLIVMFIFSVFDWKYPFLGKSGQTLYEKLSFLKIPAQAFEAGGFLNIFLRFWGFEACSFIKNHLIKKNSYVFTRRKIAFTSWSI